MCLNSLYKKRLPILYAFTEPSRRGNARRACKIVKRRTVDFFNRKSRLAFRFSSRLKGINRLKMSVFY